jgi:hypothetical protein
MITPKISDYAFIGDSRSAAIISKFYRKQQKNTLSKLICSGEHGC